MSDSYKDLLSNLVQISRVDSSLAGIEAERARANAEMAALAQSLKLARNETAVVQAALKEKQAKVHCDELRVRDEREKLVARRKALVTLNNYKLQQSAEKEIEYAAKQLDAQEDLVIKLMEEVEALTSRHATAASAQAALEKKIEDEKLEIESLFVNLKEREDNCLDQKAALITKVDAGSLGVYNRVRERYPKDAVVALNGGNCTGCLMQLGPQILVQLSKANAVIKCRGCGRILFLEESSS